MLTFLDGPALGAALPARRAPRLLRVVQGRRGFEVLDHVTDVPHEDELVYCYRRIQRMPKIYLDWQGQGLRRLRPGWYQSAIYQFVDPQPDESIMRRVATWRGWCWATLHPRRAARPQRVEEVPGGDAVGS